MFMTTDKVNFMAVLPRSFYLALHEFIFYG